LISKKKKKNLRIVMRKPFFMLQYPMKIKSPEGFFIHPDSFMETVGVEPIKKTIKAA